MLINNILYQKLIDGHLLCIVSELRLSEFTLKTDLLPFFK